MAKTCELKVNIGADRHNVIIALVNAGYKVSEKEKQSKKGYPWEKDCFVIVESKGGDE